jgi:probable HAF family extracellular repeat protein
MSTYQKKLNIGTLHRRQFLMLSSSSLISIAVGACGGGGKNDNNITPTPASSISPTPMPTPTSTSTPIPTPSPRPTPQFGITWTQLSGLRDMFIESMSGDGRVFGGYRVGFEGVRWEEPSNLTNLGYLREGDNFVQISDVSEDGSVLVGESSGFSTRDEAIIWTREQGMVGLGHLPNPRPRLSSVANAVSGDGKIVTGTCDLIENSFWVTHAFIWTKETGMKSLGILSPNSQNAYGYTSTASGISQDGKIIVGESSSEAFRWTAEGGMKGIGVLPNFAVSKAWNISADGNVIIGECGRPINNDPNRLYVEAFRWTSATGMVSLGQTWAGGQMTSARQISGDGGVILGYTDYPTSENSLSFSNSFIWTRRRGTQRVRDFLLFLGIPNNISAGNIPFVSTDGKILVFGRDKLYSPTGFADL